MYVGKTIDPDSRWAEHLGAARRGLKEPLYRSMRKHGDDRFEFTIIEAFSSEEEAYCSERCWIQRFRDFGVRLYNLNDGGRGPLNPTAESRARMRENHPRSWLGKRHSDESKKLMSDHNSMKRADVKAKHLKSLRSDEVRTKISENCGSKRDDVRAKLSVKAKEAMADPLLRKRISSSLKGRTFSPEHREKLAEAARRQHARNSVTKDG